MATTEMDYENETGDRFEDNGPRFDRDNRSASPRGDNGHDSARRRSASPTGTGGGDRDFSAPVKDERDSGKGDREGDDGAVNPGSNLFVTGIHPRLTESEVMRLFEKYGDVEKCQIMRDPHTKESRGFGFVKMVTSDQADAAKEGLQGEQYEGRTLSIEKARRARPRTPTPGKYFGPPKREGGGRGGGRFGGDRFDDRRRGGYGGGGGGGYGRSEDPYRYRGYSDRRGGGYDDRGPREDRGYDSRDRGFDRRDRDDTYAPRIDRYASGGREDRYPPRGGADDRRGPGFERGPREDRGYDRGYDRERAPRDAPPAAAGYAESAPRAEARDYGGMSDSAPRYSRD